MTDTLMGLADPKCPRCKGYGRELVTGPAGVTDETPCACTQLESQTERAERRRDPEKLRAAVEAELERLSDAARRSVEVVPLGEPSRAALRDALTRAEDDCKTLRAQAARAAKRPPLDYVLSGLGVTRRRGDLGWWVEQHYSSDGRYHHTWEQILASCPRWSWLVELYTDLVVRHYARRSSLVRAVAHAIQPALWRLDKARDGRANLLYHVVERQNRDDTVESLHDEFRRAEEATAKDLKRLDEHAEAAEFYAEDAAMMANVSADFAARLAIVAAEDLLHTTREALLFAGRSVLWALRADVKPECRALYGDLWDLKLDRVDGTLYLGGSAATRVAAMQTVSIRDGLQYELAVALEAFVAAQSGAKS